MCNVEEESIKHIFVCDAFKINKNDLLKKWKLDDIIVDDFFKCGDQRTWKKRALKAKLIKRALQNQETRLHDGNDLSQSQINVDQDDVYNSTNGISGHDGLMEKIQDSQEKPKIDCPKENNEQSNEHYC